MDDRIFLAPLAEFSPKHTFECGQCFRWAREADDSYTGVACGRAARVISEGGSVFLSSAGAAAEEGFWRAYFDLDRNYREVADALPLDRFTREAVTFGQGLRILRQEPWEALVSFILSQCNNISRIRLLVDRLCRMFGEPMDFEGKKVFAFPPPERIAPLDEAALAPLRAGYRAAYLPAAARMVLEGRPSFESLETLSTGDARCAIRALPGVGAKVADCFLLFGLGRMDAFPVDTWMKKAAAYYPEGLSAERFGPYAGIFQQYIFYYARSLGRAGKEISGEENPRQ